MIPDVRAYLKWTGSCQVGNKVYFTNITFGGLFYLDIEDLSIHFVHRFTFYEPVQKKDWGSFGVYYNQVVFFVTSNAGLVAMYDLLNGQEKMIPINYDKEIYVYDIVRYKDVVYLFPPELSEGIYVLDLKKQEVEKDEELSNLFQDGFSFNCNILLRNGSLALISRYEGRQLVEIDLEKKKIVYTKTFTEPLSIYAVYFDTNTYWILQTHETDIYAWNRENDTLQKYVCENPVWNDMKNVSAVPYVQLVFLEKEILVLPTHLKYIMRIDKNTKQIGNPLSYPKGFKTHKKGFRGCSVCAGYTVLEDKVLLYPLGGNMILIYDKITRTLSGIEACVWGKDVPYLQDIIFKKFLSEELKSESDHFETLENYITLIACSDHEDKSNSQKNIGQMIYQEMKEQIDQIDI